MNKKDNLTKILGKRIAQLRKAKGLTQEQLAEQTGVTRRVIAYYEREAKSMSAELLLKIAKTLKVSIDDLANFKFNKDDDIINKWKLWRRVRLVNQLSPYEQRAVFHYIKALIDKKDTYKP